MTPKEKAKELVEKFIGTISNTVASNYSYSYVENIDEAAKQCALIAVDEMIKQSVSISPMVENSYKIEFHRQHITFLQQVKEEISKL